MTLLAQNIIVGIIIIAALAWITVKLVRAHKKGNIGCSCCSIADSCIHSGEATSQNSSCAGLKEAISQKSPCPHCPKNHKSSEICCSVPCPRGKDTASSQKSNHHENNKNLE